MSFITLFCCATIATYTAANLYPSLVLLSLQGSGGNNVQLDKVDPGTHVVEAQITYRIAGRDGAVVNADPITTVFDRVLTADEGGPDGIGRLSLASDPRPSSRVCLGACATAAIPRKRDSIIRLMFVGMLKYDGQKTIWLHQFKRLDRSRFLPQFNTFMDPSHQPNSEQMMEVRSGEKQNTRQGRARVVNNDAPNSAPTRTHAPPVANTILTL